MNFTVIDFETANSKRASACALGIVKVVNGEIVDKKSWLIKPHDMKFNGMNIGIHGIRPEDVKDCHEFDYLYETEFKKYIENQLIVAHNASFDMSVLRKSLDHYGIEYPEFDYLCTVKLSKRVWPELMNHKLNTVSDFLGFDFKHHDALDDCLASANIMINACNKEEENCPVKLSEKFNIRKGNVYPGGYNSCSSK
ncbi:MAG: 3'-5' exonuclease [Firmicutes bacterium]|jgi:DNA polymerase-3 subunit epsilon|nr:3'-5' exonuclease [Bacillota bacterium]